MDTVLIIVAVVAVVLVVGGLLYRRRGATAVEREAPEAPKKISGEEESPGAGPATPERRSETRSEPAERPSGPSAAPEPIAEAEEVAEPEPEETEEDVRERVQTLLTDSERMLGELREASGGEGEEGGADSGVDIMAEGLEEVKALADQERWSQARTKGEALYSQLSHMLQDVRRQQTS